MNFLIDLLPAVLFFVAYLGYGLYTATAVLIASCFAVVLIKWIRTRTLPKVALGTAVVAALLGGLTLKFHNPEFIKFKPTVIYAAFSLALLASHFIGDKVLMARLPQQMVNLPDAVWRRVNLAWAAFFAFCAVLNLYVAANYSEAVWVKLKAFGFTGLIFVFVLLHGPFLMRYMQDEPQKKPSGGDSDGSR